MLPLWLESLREITISPILGLGHKVVLVETQRTQGLLWGLNSRWCFLWPFLPPLSLLMLPLWLERLRELKISPVLGLGHRCFLLGPGGHRSLCFFYLQ